MTTPTPDAATREALVEALRAVIFEPVVGVHGLLFVSEAADAILATLAMQPILAAIEAADAIEAVALRRVQVFDGDGEMTLEVSVAADDAPALVAFLMSLDVGDVYDDPVPDYAAALSARRQEMT